MAAEKQQVTPPPGPVPMRRPLQEMLPPPSMDIPIAIPEGDLDFDVEVTNFNQKPLARKPRIDDVVPLDDDEEEEAEVDVEMQEDEDFEDDRPDEPQKLASDST